MSFDLLFFQPAAEPPLHPDDLAAAVMQVPGLTLDGDDGAPYRPGRWQHPTTGAAAVVDLGEPPLERDDIHPPRSYDGWRPLPLVWHLPLSGPHWHAVEALTAIEGLLAALPGVLALDPEDVHEVEGAEAGPYPWNRPRLIASWESQRRDRCDQLAVPAMARGASLRLWRYRREHRDAAQVRPDLAWPEALVLHQRAGGAARTACLWPTGGRPWALPPVELVVVPGSRTRVVPADQVVATDAGLPGLAALVADDAVPPADGVGPEGFLALQDGDWRD